MFDYLVPPQLADGVSPGDKIRIDLHGRRVSGWVTRLGPHDPSVHFDDVARMSALVSVSGRGVEPELIDLTRWVADTWWGPWRAVLSSASSPRARLRPAHRQRGASHRIEADSLSETARRMKALGGGLLVVPPLASALHVVAAWAESGPVLVVCPTTHMAVAGAASLRRRGYTVALAPDDWEKARSGVDVVIGARSAVFAPCDSLSGIIVVDEHDELLHEERVPTWDAVSVARERARLAGVPFLATSPTPSPASLASFESNIERVSIERDWPEVSIVDLGQIPVAGSLLSSELLASVKDSQATTVCVLNTKGKARLIVCKSCRAMQVCPDCNALLSHDEEHGLTCPRCHESAGSVCLTCGRTSFVVPRIGVTQLRAQIEASTGAHAIEVTSDAVDDWTKGHVFIGTEAVLHRVRSADCIVFADLDRDIGAPRMSANQEVLALVARAARIVGPRGKLIIQTRMPDHSVMRALASSDVQQALLDTASADLAMRHSLTLPPYSRVVRVTVTNGHDPLELALEGVQIARDDGSFLVRSTDGPALDAAVRTMKAAWGSSVRIHADPVRY